MVRLKASEIEFVNPCFVCFNSLMVRLKVEEMLTNWVPRNMFQFLDGAIKRMKYMTTKVAITEVSIP